MLEFIFKHKQKEYVDTQVKALKLLDNEDELKIWIRYYEVKKFEIGKLLYLKKDEQKFWENAYDIFYETAMNRLFELKKLRSDKNGIKS